MVWRRSFVLIVSAKLEISRVGKGSELGSLFVEVGVVTVLLMTDKETEAS